MSCSCTQLPDASVSGLMTDRLMLKSFNVADVGIVNNCSTHWFFEPGQLPNQVSLFASFKNQYVMYSKTVFIFGVVFDVVQPILMATV